MAFVRSIVAAALIAFPVLAAPPAQAKDPIDRAAVEAIIKDYLLKNPEVLEDALNELQNRRAAAQVEQQQKALTANRDTVLGTEKDVVLGDPKGDVTLVEFFDYNCGYCKRGLADLVKLLDTDKKLRVVLKDYPILGQGSIDAALVAVAVKQQIKGEKFLAFHKALLGTRGPVGKEQAVLAARDAGVDMVKLEQDLASPAGKTLIAETLKLGEAIGAQGTPTYVLGNEAMPGAVGYDVLKRKIDALRRCGETVCG